MEHLAAAIQMDPLELRMKNMLRVGDELLDGSVFAEEAAKEANPLPTLIDQLKHSAKYDERMTAVAQFNTENRWKKRGLSLVPVRYLHSYFGNKFHILISVYSGDGTVSVSHGGIEMGQGINTKVAQTVAKELGISVHMIKVKPSSNLISPNDSGTDGSVGSDCACWSALHACADLKQKMKRVKDTMDNPTWVDLVRKCEAAGVDLSARQMCVATFSVGCRRFFYIL